MRCKTILLALSVDKKHRAYKYINIETCNDWTMVIPLFLKKNNTSKSAELCCTFGNRYSQKGTCNTSFVPAALASCTSEIIVQDPASAFKLKTLSTVSKLSEPKVHTSEAAAINLVHFSRCQKATQQCMKRQPGCGISYLITFTLQQVKKYLKPIYLSETIYNMYKPVYLSIKIGLCYMIQILFQV